MDAGAVGGWIWCGDGSGDSYEAYEGVFAVGFKGKARRHGKGKGDSHNGGSFFLFESASTRRKVRPKGQDCRGSVALMESRVIPQGNAPRKEAIQRKQKTVTKEMAKAGDWGRPSGK